MKLLFFVIIIVAKLTFANVNNNVDVESLGLDNVDTKNGESNKVKKKPPPIDIILKPEEKNQISKDGGMGVSDIIKFGQKYNNTNSNVDSHNIKKSKKSSFSQAAGSFFSRKTNDLKKRASNVTNKVAGLFKEPEVSNIITIRSEQVDAIREKKRQNHKYLLGADYPKPKNKISPDFLTTDIAPPLLSRSFSDENLHHPILTRYSDKINLLFNEIESNNINDFNAVLREIYNVNIYNGFDETPLIFAASLRRTMIIASLISAGANPDLKNKLGLTAINIAIRMADYEMVKLLVESGADLKSRDNFGETYLMQAVRVGYLPVIDYFASKNIEINAVNRDNLTAFNLAQMTRNNVVQQLLLKYGAQENVIVQRSIINELEGKWGY